MINQYPIKPKYRIRASSTSGSLIAEAKIGDASATGVFSIKLEGPRDEVSSYMETAIILEMGAYHHENIDIIKEYFDNLSSEVREGKRNSDILCNNIELSYSLIKRSDLSIDDILKELESDKNKNLENETDNLKKDISNNKHLTITISLEKIDHPVNFISYSIDPKIKKGQPHVYKEKFDGDNVISIEPTKNSCTLRINGNSYVTYKKLHLSANGSRDKATISTTDSNAKYKISSGWSCFNKNCWNSY